MIRQKINFLQASAYFQRSRPKPTGRRETNQLIVCMVRCLTSQRRIAGANSYEKNVASATENLRSALYGDWRKNEELCAWQ
jgi:hypothetical protein